MEWQSFFAELKNFLPARIPLRPIVLWSLFASIVTAACLYYAYNRTIKKKKYLVDSTQMSPASKLHINNVLYGVLSIVLIYWAFNITFAVKFYLANMGNEANMKHMYWKNHWFGSLLGSYYNP